MKFTLILGACLLALVAAQTANQPKQGGPGGKGEGEHRGGPGGFGGRKRLASCESSKTQQKTCIEGRMKSAGLDIDMEAVGKCFSTCQPQKGQEKQGGPGKEGQQGDKAKWTGEKTGPARNGTNPNAEAFKCFMTENQKCFEEKTKGVQFATEEKGKDDKGGLHRGFGGGFKGEKGGEKGDSDFLGQLVKKAKACGSPVESCVNGLIKPALLANTAESSKKIKSALCASMNSCPASQQCTKDKETLRLAECSCRDVVKAKCPQPAVSSVSSSRADRFGPNDGSTGKQQEDRCGPNGAKAEENKWCQA